MSLGTTIGEKLVAAALALEDAGKTTFSAEDLAVIFHAPLAVSSIGPFRGPKSA
jgi:hypothetical protein